MKTTQKVTYEFHCGKCGRANRVTTYGPPCPQACGRCYEKMVVVAVDTKEKAK